MNRLWTLFAIVALVAAACSGDGTRDVAANDVDVTEAETVGAETDDQVDETSTSTVVETTTPTTVAVETTTANEVENTKDDSKAAELGDCNIPEPPAGLPNAEQFTLVPEENIFACFGIESYRFEGSLRAEGQTGDLPGNVDIDSVAVVVDGEPRFQSNVEIDGARYESLRIGDAITVLNPDASVDELTASNAFAFLELPSTQGQLAMGAVGTIVVHLYGEGAVEVGTETKLGRTVTLWEAGPSEIAASLSSTFPVAVEISDGFVRVWADEDGLVLRIEAEVSGDDVTVAGVPMADFPAAADAGLFTGTYSFDYVEFNNDVQIS